MNKDLIILLFFLFCSCSQSGMQQEGVPIFIFRSENDFHAEDRMELQFIPLEATNDCLFSDIQKIQIVDDKIFIIDNKNLGLFVFDLFGKFITQVGTRGEGPGEYMQPYSFYISKETQTITVADNVRCILLHFNLADYTFVSSQKTGNFMDCAWLSDGNIAWVQPSGFVTDKREAYYVKITDKDLNELKLLLPTHFSPNYLLTAGEYFYKKDGDTYLNLSFLPIVYKIESDRIVSAFSLDLTPHRLASLEWLQNNAADHYTGALTKTDYISAYNVKETEDYLSVCYYAKGANDFIGFYNKKEGTSCKYTGVDFLKRTGLVGLGEIKGTYQDYFIATITSGILKLSYIEREDLRKISMKISEEDNPVLCLFKFKE